MEKLFISEGALKYRLNKIYNSMGVKGRTECVRQLRDQLDATHLIDFRGEKLPLSAVRGKAYDPDPEVRREAYEAEIASYKAIELPMSFCLNSIKMEARTMAEATGYDSVLDMTLSQSRMDRETLDAMWTAIGESLPAFRRYLRACRPDASHLHH